MTILFPSPVFGPVTSRRLGVSLGVNLLPADGKRCSFDCIYCECGLNKDGRTTSQMTSREEVRQALERRLEKIHSSKEPLDVITFAGNGEPTLHPQFAGIIDDTIELRNRFFPLCQVSVLSNATQILKPDVFDALRKVDNNILKLDTVSEEFIRLVDRPGGNNFQLGAIIDKMREFGNDCIIQTMFLSGTYNGKDVDNCGDKYVLPWIEVVKSIDPSSVMIYTIARETPVNTLKPASKQQLDGIAEKVRGAGLECQVSY